MDSECVAASHLCLVKLSIRLTAAEAERFAFGANLARMSRVAYPTDLFSNIPVLTAGVIRLEKFCLHGTLSQWDYIRPFSQLVQVCGPCLHQGSALRQMGGVVVGCCHLIAFLMRQL